jgi:hypothetical protein
MRKYYTARQGKVTGYGLESLHALVLGVYEELRAQQYFQEAEGCHCDNCGRITTGSMGASPEDFVHRRLLRDGLWPFKARLYVKYTEDDLFDIIELLHDLVSRPLGRARSGCDDDYCPASVCDLFDSRRGRAEFRTRINEIVASYGGGWELTEAGEIVPAVEPGLAALLAAATPTSTAQARSDLVSEAVRIYRSRGSSLVDRQGAVRMLADLLEELRPEARRLLNRPDESDLFELANRFGIRHRNAKQKTEYDANIWTSWCFYYYLATVHALLNLIARESADDPL